MSIDMNGKSLIENLVDWHIGFKKLNSIGDVTIPPKGKITLPNDEILSQIYDKNNLFVGENYDGSHARIYIHNKDIRVDAGFEGSDEKSNQIIISNEKLKELYDSKTFKTFAKDVETIIITDGEKFALAEYAKKNKINDHEKIKFVEQYTGFKVD